MESQAYPLAIGFWLRIGELQQALAAAQREALIDAQRESEQAYRNYVEVLRNLRDESLQRLGEAYAASTPALQAGPAPGSTTSAQQGARTEALEQLYDSISRGYQESGIHYADSLQTAGKTATKLLIETYRTYLQSLKEAWAQLDVDAILSESSADARFR